MNLHDGRHNGSRFLRHSAAAPSTTSTLNSSSGNVLTDFKTGSGISLREAREAQFKTNASLILTHKEKMREKRLQKAEKDMIRYNIDMGDTLGQGNGLTHEDARELQLMAHSDAVRHYGDLQTEVEKKQAKLPDSEEVPKLDKDTAMKAARAELQKKYSSGNA